MLCLENKNLFDKYSRRSINWILISYWYGFGTILSLVNLSFYLKLDEIMEVAFRSLFVLVILAFFIVKNLLIKRRLVSFVPYEKEKQYQKELRFVLISSSGYWLTAVGVLYFFEKIFVLNIAPFLTAIYVLGIIIYNFTRINRFTYERKKHNKLVIITISIVAVVMGGYTYLSRDIWLTQPYINATPYIYEGGSKISYDEVTGIYTITKQEGDYRILQLTDIHLGGGVLSYDKDLKALKAVYELLCDTKPDLVIVTGDLVFPVGWSSFSFNNTAPVQQFAAFMRNTGIPWAFTYGNHDTESYAATSSNDLNTLYKSLSYKTSRTLLYPYIQPNITGRNNQLIELKNADGTFNQLLFLMDSNAYTGEGLNKYDYIHDDQVEWYRREILRIEEEAGYIVPSMVFFHMPLQEYRTAYELYEHQGIRLTYGMSIDYLAMPGIARDTNQRGGTLITIHDDGSTDIKQVPLN